MSLTNMLCIPELDDSETSLVCSDVESIYNVLHEVLHGGEVFRANTSRTIEHEDDVCSDRVLTPYNTQMTTTSHEDIGKGHKRAYPEEEKLGMHRGVTMQDIKFTNSQGRTQQEKIGLGSAGAYPGYKIE